MHFDFTIPKGLKIILSDETKKVKREEQEKEDKSVEEKKRLTFPAFNFCIVYFGVSGEKKILDFFNIKFNQHFG